MPDRAAGYRPLPVESVCCCCHTWHLTPGHGSVDGHTESWDIEILKKKKKIKHTLSTDQNISKYTIYVYMLYNCLLFLYQCYHGHNVSSKYKKDL